MMLLIIAMVYDVVVEVVAVVVEDLWRDFRQRHQVFEQW